MEHVWGLYVFTFRKNRFLHLGKTMKLRICWMYFTIKFFSVSFVTDEKRTVTKSFSTYFGHHSLSSLNSFLNIMNKYDVLILNKYNLEQVICFIHKFVLAIFLGPRAEDKSRGPRVEEHKHPSSTTYLLLSLFEKTAWKLKRPLINELLSMLPILLFL